MKGISARRCYLDLALSHAKQDEVVLGRPKSVTIACAPARKLENIVPATSGEVDLSVGLVEKSHRPCTRRDRCHRLTVDCDDNYPRCRR